MTWITESEAAELLQLTKPYLRKRVKKGFLPIAYTSVEGRRYRYSAQDINKIFTRNASTKIK